ncbi:MAG: hypothetical protein AVDCRST_MAG72-805 [uncultured Nocardioidaceae bacterium]|uniref:Uncharacterized protein n=1 Tax=uncultured Nocardioidaceae bacterium TaxID=253824 RepID=A0A6J4LSU0_9ACTN|nr:MAG: hypothetical protein AVDCRST_MAG72-805 [uncultured Nocardioidaceae bacterium]
MPSSNRSGVLDRLLHEYCAVRTAGARQQVG